MDTKTRQAVEKICGALIAKQHELGHDAGRLDEEVRHLCGRLDRLEEVRRYEDLTVAYVTAIQLAVIEVETWAPDDIVLDYADPLRAYLSDLVKSLKARDTITAELRTVLHQQQEGGGGKIQETHPNGHAGGQSSTDHVDTVEAAR